MISAFPFDPSHPPEFFTVMDHRLGFRKSGESAVEPAPDSLLKETAALLRTFLQIPENCSISFHHGSQRTTSTIDVLSAQAAHAEMKDWTYHLPYANLTSFDIMFDSCFGFGIPDGPVVTIGSIKPAAAVSQVTSNQLSLFLLNGVVRDMTRRGREIIRRETEYKAAVLEGVLERHLLLHPLIKDSGQRNKMLVAVTAGHHADCFAQHLNDGGIRYGRNHEAFYFANTPAHSKESVEKLADQIEVFR